MRAEEPSSPKPGVPSGPDPAGADMAEAARTVWDALPPKARLPLLISGTGDAHLTPVINTLAEDIAQRESTRPVLHPVLNDAAQHAWETSLFSAQFASIALMLHEQKPFLQPGALVLCKLCKSLKPGDEALAKRVQRMLMAGETDSVTSLLEKALAAEKGNLFWLYFASFVGFRIGDLAWFEKLLTSLPLPGALHPGLRADCLYVRGEWQQAAELYKEAYALAGLTEWLVRRGECLKRLDRREEAAACWRRAFLRRPWQVNLLFRLTDLHADADVPCAPPSGKGRILLYSWNHGSDLDRTFAGLYDSDLGEADILFLDNGSTDNTPEIAAAWQQRFGRRMRAITLPTNVGAPAARNWLLCTEEAREADWVVFLDDDALVPPDWLGLFGRAARNHPEAHIIGCRVVDQAAPMVLQSVDLHLTPIVEEDGRLSARGKFSMVETHRMTLDYGQFSYLRPATSVTGCCHLLFRKGIEEAGLFDLRFSPSQFDDFERDLRAETRNQNCLYQGHLAVRHLKRTGASAQMSPWQTANVEGNLKKLMLSYPPEKLGDIIKQDVARQERFLKKTLKNLAAQK